MAVYLRCENMIENLKLENYRCFSNHTISFKENNIIVGENNAGKSTIIEALRIISIITSRYKHINYSPAPEWLDLPLSYKGIRPSLKEYDFNFESVFHRYGEPPSKLTATFSNATKVLVYLGSNETIFAVIVDEKGKVIANKSQAKNVLIPDIRILPQITSLKLKEKKLAEDYVHRSQFSNLSSQHFRNELLLHQDKFKMFGDLVGKTWDGCEIESLELSEEFIEPTISLFVRDSDFVAEVGWMGHGLQMWIQIMWFLSFVSTEDVVILDEPDVYMHADLQRKIIKLLNGNNFSQTIVATHSLEIISEAAPEDILVVDKARPSSKFANSIPSVQKLIDQIGCLHNIQLTRFWKCKKCILVEGKDIDILKHLHNTLFPYSEHPFETIPNMSIGGWSGLKYAIGTSLILKNSAGESVNTYCILDRDYYPDDNIHKVHVEAEKKDLILHIWKRKEIENYLVIPEAIHRVIENISNSDIIIEASEIQIIIDRICDELRDETFDKISDEIRKSNRDEQEKANSKARDIIDSHWNSLDNKLKLVSGKNLISKLSKWSQDTYDISFSVGSIVREIKEDEIDTEMKYVIESIENNNYF